MPPTVNPLIFNVGCPTPTGTPSQKTTLIENGKLVSYMQDRQNARLMKVRATGNGRRQSYAHQPMPRMSNTMMANGKHDPQEIIKSTKKGIFAKTFGGGQVDITNGNLCFLRVKHT